MVALVARDTQQIAGALVKDGANARCESAAPVARQTLATVRFFVHLAELATEDFFKSAAFDRLRQGRRFDRQIEFDR